MRKIIAAFNMSVDGSCDHKSGVADDEIHEHYAELLRAHDLILYGRTTFELMKYWKDVVRNPTGNKAEDDFAVVMDKIPKLVFSHTLQDTEWSTARLATKSLEEEVRDLIEQKVGDVLVGSRSLIVALLNLGLVDEFQICVQPLIIGQGLMLFDQIEKRIDFQLLHTKTFTASGSVLFTYKPVK